MNKEIVSLGMIAMSLLTLNLTVFRNNFILTVICSITILIIWVKVGLQILSDKKK
ncbi:Uncharacterised protein [[Clostridium] sordellii]|uniref:hypothetical protein n=1 Tax=Paraclostridium sordellii TaxID=1505 RepID=UPI0005E93D09|nr:hypothetical protein [Paeniclostridium sordellii]CEP43277.1 Uncharacterised protein [[Clostridium] sordellii] [Paeniclostridium sordellii]